MTGDVSGIEYELIYSKRKSLSLQITVDGAVIVRAPSAVRRSEIEHFLFSKKEWILMHQREAVNAKKEKMSGRMTPEERNAAIEKAGSLFSEKARYYAERMGVVYHRITIREQKTRWGSCSSQGNLNFNWKLVLAPEKVFDYVVIHELAHLKEMNHSPAFYRIVEGCMPDYKKWKMWLRENGKYL